MTGKDMLGSYTPVFLPWLSGVQGTSGLSQEHRIQGLTWSLAWWVPPFRTLGLSLY